MARALPLAEAADQENAERTALALNDYLAWAYQRLSRHALNQRRRRQELPPINFLLTKWAAVRPDLPSFQEQNGLRAASVENYPLYIGIARACGMTPVTAPHHDEVAEDFREKLLAAEDLFRQGYEFVHLHAKGPDIAAHRKDPLAKKIAIEAVDSVLGPLVNRIEQHADVLVVVTGDHATPSSGPLIHSGEAVPIVIVGGANVLADEVKSFHERAAIAGGLGRIHGLDVMPVLLNLSDRIRLHGVRHQRQLRPYWPRQMDFFVVNPAK